jgi:uncharacterized protein (DUF1778 family)
MRCKLSADVSEKEMKIIDRAIVMEQRTRANFIRLACLERAKRILKENEKSN